MLDQWVEIEYAEPERLQHTLTALMWATVGTL